MINNVVFKVLKELLGVDRRQGTRHRAFLCLFANLLPLFKIFALFNFLESILSRFIGGICSLTSSFGNPFDDFWSMFFNIRLK